jgi:hypothetical protein
VEDGVAHVALCSDTMISRRRTAVPMARNSSMTLSSAISSSSS